MRKIMQSMKKLIISFALYLLSVSAGAISTDSISSGLELNLRSGYAFTSNGELMNRFLDRDPEDGKITHTALSWHIQYKLSGIGDSLTRSVYQGAGLGMTTFSAPKVVGTPVSFYVLQGAPIVVVNNNLSIDYEWNFGLSTGWKKSTTGHDLHSNLVVGSKTNAYLNLGFKAIWSISGPWQLSAGIDLSHYSNGNTSWPNPGVNTIGGRIGIQYNFNHDISRPVSSPFRRVSHFEQKMVYDIMAFGAWRKTYFPYERAGFDAVGEAYLLPGHFGVAGLNFSPMWCFHPIFRTGVSADFQWSGCNALIYEDFSYRKPDAWKQLTLGLSARAELVMPVFTLNVGLGYGLLGSYETRKFYQMVNLKTYFRKGLYLNVGYRLIRFRSPSNLMLGVGYTFGQ